MGDRINGERALVIGGTRGIGAAVVESLIDSGAGLVIAAARRVEPDAVEKRRVVYAAVDVTDADSVRRLSERFSDEDLSIVVNCAGVNGNGNLRAADFLEVARREMAVNYFGLLNVASVFGPRLAARGGGTLMSILSFVSHVNIPSMATYCASKAAAHSALQAVRAAYRPAGVVVAGVYPTAVDTEMTRGQPGPKLAPGALASEMIQALRAGQEEVFPGPAADAFAELLADPRRFQAAALEQ